MLPQIQYVFARIRKGVAELTRCPIIPGVASRPDLCGVDILPLEVEQLDSLLQPMPTLLIEGISLVQKTLVVG